MKLKLSSIRRAKAAPAATGGHFRVALQGFSDFERNALVFCLKHAATRDPTYVHVERAAQADFIVADASHEALATSATRGPRMRDTLFVGDRVPDGAIARVARPIDPEEILRALDAMVAAREAPPPRGEPPDVVLPLAPGVGDFPTLSEFDIVETTPAAFEHAPVLINLADLEPIARPRARGTPQPAASPAPGPAQAQPPRSRQGTAPQTPTDPERDEAQGPDPQAPDPQVLDPQVLDPQVGEPLAAHPLDLGSQAFDAAAATASQVPLASARAPEDDAAATARSAPLAAEVPAARPDPDRRTTPSVGAAQAADSARGAAAADAAKAPLSAADRAAAKAAARRRSRLARLAQSGSAQQQTLRDVLVLDPRREHDALAAQLGAFGFAVHAATNSADALALLARMPLAAVFLDVAPASDDDLDGLELCMEIKHRPVESAGAVPPVFLLANRDSAAGRVRAKLAGCDALLIRPVTRGDAARALEACDVALPSDERRAPRP